MSDGGSLAVIRESLLTLCDEIMTTVNGLTKARRPLLPA